ncbi:hypothetical protein OE88DRAFT_501543 [Heliocybe sulcata]|uniref:Uncharacterized protein n=1 Tax=Heliocybe sulcata TaxID=5364 RepID=A0A5C3MTE7_9AGAM|nr:hypothetical protein OE88DRAFT_501543 [Heliocybe sulcata]
MLGRTIPLEYALEPSAQLIKASQEASYGFAIVHPLGFHGFRRDAGDLLMEIVEEFRLNTVMAALPPALRTDMVRDVRPALISIRQGVLAPSGSQSDRASTLGPITTHDPQGSSRSLLVTGLLRNGESGRERLASLDRCLLLRESFRGGAPRLRKWRVSGGIALRLGVRARVLSTLSRIAPKRISVVKYRRRSIMFQAPTTSRKHGFSNRYRKTREFAASPPGRRHLYINCQSTQYSVHDGKTYYVRTWHSNWERRDTDTRILVK